MRLQFSNSKLYGRDREIQGLQTVYQNVLKDHRSRIVLLDGYSGNGKTRLVSHVGDWIRESVQGNKARIISGKFDEQHAKPYLGFAQAFSELVTQIMRNPEEDSECIEAIETLVAHSQVLKEIIPEIYQLMGDTEQHRVSGGAPVGSSAFLPRSSRHHDSASNLASQRRMLGKSVTRSVTMEKSPSSRMSQFRYRFMAFVRSICATKPMLLFLDDLQWADAASLELFKALCTDEESKNLMIIGAYRGQEIDESHRLSWCIFNLKTSEVLDGRLSEMLLTDLDLQDLNQFIADSLELSPQRTTSLSKVIMRKTHGNIFYSIQFLNHLVEAKLIRYDMNMFHWTWDEKEVAGATDISDNVIDMVSGRISQLPKKVIQILKIASCLWYSFEANVLKFIVINVQKESQNWQDKLSLVGNDSCKSFAPDEEDHDRIEKALSLAVEEGLLDKIGSTGYKFSHDKIREAAYSMIKDGQEKEELQVVLGQILWFMYNSQGSQQWMLFSSVDMLNKVTHHFASPALQLELADVNLEAAQQALTVSAFIPAIGYLRAGIQLLGSNPWRDHYELSLSLYSELASLESSVGHFDASEELAYETLENATSFEDMVSVYTTQIRSLGVQGKHAEALKLGFEVLWGLGETFPIAKKGAVFRWNVKTDTLATRALLKKYTDDDILALPILQKLKKQQALVILNQMTDSAFHLGKVDQLYLIINRMVRISLNDGLGGVSGVVFALYGMSLRPSNGDRRDSYRFGQLALKLQEQVGAKQWLCRVMVYVYVLLNHWQAPLQNSCDPLLTAYSSGMETGDMDYAFKSAGSFFTLNWYIGKEIKSGVLEMRKFCSKMREYKQEKTLSIYLPIFQCMLNMTGASPDPLKLCGEAISEEEYAEKKMSNKMIMTYQMQLAYYFNDLWLADSLSTALQEMVTSFEANYTYVATRFFFGLIALRVASHASGLRRRKNRALARSVIEEIKQWTKHGGVNCLSKLLILQAEWKALKYSDSKSGGYCKFSPKETVDTVRSVYDTAISTSMRSGFINDAALACELASVFCGRSMDAEWASNYKNRAITYYGQWGAIAKVEQLQSGSHHKRVSTHVSVPMSTTSTVLGQKHFRNSVLLHHEKVRVSHTMVNSERSDRATSRFEDGVLMSTAAASFGAGSGSGIASAFSTASTLPPLEGDPEEKKVP